MNIWLGKQYLGQRDTLEQTLRTPPGDPLRIEAEVSDRRQAIVLNELFAPEEIAAAHAKLQKRELANELKRPTTNFREEFRLYRRDEKGKIVKERDHLQDALKYAWVSGRDVMVPKPFEGPSKDSPYGIAARWGSRDKSRICSPLVSFGTWASPLGRIKLGGRYSLGPTTSRSRSASRPQQLRIMARPRKSTNVLEILRLRLEGFSWPQIARSTGLGQGTVRFQGNTQTSRANWVWLVM